MGFAGGSGLRVLRLGLRGYFRDPTDLRDLGLCRAASGIWARGQHKGIINRGILDLRSLAPVLTYPPGPDPITLILKFLSCPGRALNALVASKILREASLLFEPNFALAAVARRGMHFTQWHGAISDWYFGVRYSKFNEA